MFAKNINKWNLGLGWGVFTIALLVYSCTVEPTVSFWDSGEYIATAAKLQVAHPPGAPLLQMIGAFFAMFASDTSKIALMVNYVSVVSSAFTILFMFWNITNLLQKIVGKGAKLSNASSGMVLGSGLIGALSFTFSDSFWFNATETEVYAMASFVMSLLLWLGLKWTDHLNTPRGNKWVLLIAFVIGLTFGIQFMGFLAIPSLVLLFYFRTCRTINLKNFVFANIVAITLLLLVFKFSLTYVLQLFGWSEVFFVNVIGLPFNSGSLVMGIVLAICFIWSLHYTVKKSYRTTNTIILSMLFLVLGFSSWLMLPIRASVHVSINENDPSDARLLLAYYNREQYPSTESPFYGSYYSDMFASDFTEKDDRPKYERDEELGKYIIVNDYRNASRGTDIKHVGLFPRMWSDANAENYMRFYGKLEFKIKAEYKGDVDVQRVLQEFNGQVGKGQMDVSRYIAFLNEARAYIDVQPPTVWDNLRYMFHYQFGYMYVRYFMWNFVGRKNDIQGRYDGNGEWLSGLGFVDSYRLGSQENLPDEILDNKGRNTYYFLPFLLGIIGLVFQLKKNPKEFWVLFVFFMFTGIAIQFYTNPPIFQPRERDYSLVGSFYIYSIWIGIGAYGFFDAFVKWVSPKILVFAVFAICLLAVPGCMAIENWDDHNRSNRYTALAMSQAYLDATQENAGSILFTIGDNDTFPLWYAQEIEGYRTDTRIIVSGYLNTDWYMDQMKRKAYKSPAVPSQLTHEQYRYGTRDVMYHQALTESRWNIKDFMNWIASDRKETKIGSLLKKQGIDTSTYSKSHLNMVYYPTNKIRVPVHKQKVLKNGLVQEKDSSLIVDYIDIDLPRYLSKSNMLMLDILANNDWDRPIYFSGGSFDEAEFLWMMDYLQLDGLVYKLVPIKTEKKNWFEKGRIDTDVMYNIVKKWKWGNAGSPEIYHDPQTRRQSVAFRTNMARLVEKLIDENKPDKATEVITIALENMPVDYFGHVTFVEPFLEAHYKLGEVKKARSLFNKLKNLYHQRLAYYGTMVLEEQYENVAEIIPDIQGYQRIVDILIRNEDKAMIEKERLTFEGCFRQFQHMFGQN